MLGQRSEYNVSFSYYIFSQEHIAWSIFSSSQNTAIYMSDSVKHELSKIVLNTSIHLKVIHYHILWFEHHVLKR